MEVVVVECSPRANPTMSAPPSNNAAAHLVLPRLHAICNGVIPPNPAAETEADPLAAAWFPPPLPPPPPPPPPPPLHNALMTST